jgi:hypothetical protein
LDEYNNTYEDERGENAGFTRKNNYKYIFTPVARRPGHESEEVYEPDDDIYENLDNENGYFDDGNNPRYLLPTKSLLQKLSDTEPSSKFFHALHDGRLLLREPSDLNEEAEMSGRRQSFKPSLLNIVPSNGPRAPKAKGETEKNQSKSRSPSPVRSRSPGKSVSNTSRSKSKSPIRNRERSYFADEMDRTELKLNERRGRKNQPIDQPINQPVNQQTNQQSNQLIDQPVNQLVTQQTNQQSSQSVNKQTKQPIDQLNQTTNEPMNESINIQQKINIEQSAESNNSYPTIFYSDNLNPVEVNMNTNRETNIEDNDTNDDDLKFITYKDSSTNDINDDDEAAQTSIPLKPTITSDVSFDRYLTILLNGILVTKYNRNGGNKQCILKFNESEQKLEWGKDVTNSFFTSSKKNRNNESSIEISDITELRKGRNTEVLKKASTADPTKALSIITTERSLDIVFSTIRERDSILKVLETITSRI